MSKIWKEFPFFYKHFTKKAYLKILQDILGAAGCRQGSIRL